jgi:AGCS family alanine or glycine:cation symporter
LAFIILVFNADKVPAAFSDIIGSAFGFREAAGGAAGYGMMQAIRFGIARGLFSNEAGQGSAPIAHAAAKTKNPVEQGEIAMIGVFIDTMVICTMTALVILTVQGDFMRNSAADAAKNCLSAGHIKLPIDPSTNQVIDFESTFPKADSLNRDEMLANNGPLALSLLKTCAGKDSNLVSSHALNAAYPSEFAIVSGKAYRSLQLTASEDNTNKPAMKAAQKRLKSIKESVDREMLSVKHAWETDAESSAITTRAYGAAFPGGHFVVPIALFVFAFTTIIGWSYYGEQAIGYLVGSWATQPFRFAWVAVVFAGALADPAALWLIGDLANASMVFPNLIAIIALSGVVYAMHKKNSGDI